MVWGPEHITCGNKVMGTEETEEFINAGGLMALMALANRYLQSNPPDNFVKDCSESEHVRGPFGVFPVFM